jgi:hypothetical protein
MDNTQLNPCFRKYGFDRIRKSLQAIDTGDQDIFYSTILQFITYLQPELGTFIFTNPYPLYVFSAFRVDPQCDIGCLRDDPPFFTDFIVHRIQEYDRIKTIQSPAAPLPCFFHDFISYIGNGGRR